MPNHHAVKNKCVCSTISLLLINCGLNNSQVDNTRDLDVVMLMYNLIEYRNNYAKTPGSVLQYHQDDPNAKYVEIVAPWKYLSNF